MTRQLLSTDFFQIETERPLSNVDVELLTDLYLPIIGPEGLALYLKLTRFKEDRPKSHSHLFESLGFTSGNFVLARKKLEGIGLLETRLLNEDEKCQLFLYVVNPPVSGKKFLTNELLRNELNKVCSEDVISWLEVVYKLTKTKRVKGGKDISENFSEVFHSETEVDLRSSLNGLNSSKHTIKTSFNAKKFIETLHEFNDIITENFFSREELIKIEELVVTYHYSEEGAADLIISSIDYSLPKGNRVDFTKYKQTLIEDQGMQFLKKAEDDKNKDKIVIPGQSDAAKLMREMQNLPSESFLLKKQDGGRLANSDKALIGHLREMNLRDPAINALLDYVLDVQDGSLPAAYVTKIAGAMARKGLDNAIDAYNYLHKTSKPKTPKAEVETIVLTKALEPVKENEAEEDLLDMFGED